MKIVFFIHCFFPTHFYGTETYTLELARHYQAWGHDVTVVSAVFQGELASAQLLTRYEYQGIPVVSINKNFISHTCVKETYYQSEIRPTLQHVLNSLNPDLVHVTHLINHTAILLEITRAMGIPTFATFTDFFGFCLNNKLETANGDLCGGPSPSRINCVACHLKAASHSPDVGPWMRYWSKPQLAHWLAVGVNMARRFPALRGGPIDDLVEDIVQRPNILRELYNEGYQAAVAPTRFLSHAYTTNGITVPLREIWFGVDIDRSPKPERKLHQPKIIGFIGQIAPHKGIDLLIEAFAHLAPWQAELRIYGSIDQDHAYMTKLRIAADDLNISFKGTFDNQEMAKILRDIDLLVIPSRWYENSPLVLLNALATHTPVLISDVAGMTEFLQPGVNGEAFKRGSVDDLTLKLTALVESPTRLQELSKTTAYERSSEIMAKDTFLTYGT